MMHVHWIFVPKYQHRVFTTQNLYDPRSIFAGVRLDFESQLVELDGE